MSLAARVRIMLLALLAAGLPRPGVPLPGQAPSPVVEAPLPSLVDLPSGMPVGGDRPGGWSHRVLESRPRTATGDVATLPPLAAATASRFRTILLADVRRDGDHHRLARVGRGLALPVGDGAAVVTPEDQGPSDLSPLDRAVLPLAGSELRRGRLVAASPHFAVYDAPVMMRVGGDHREVRVRHALVVEPTEGRLRVVTWAVAPGPKGAEVVGDLVVPPAGLVFVCDLDVAARRVLGLPVSWSLAMRDLPPGRPLGASEGLRALAAGDLGDPAVLAGLEARLTAAVGASRANGGPDGSGAGRR